MYLHLFGASYRTRVCLMYIKQDIILHSLAQARHKPVVQERAWWLRAAQPHQRRDHAAEMAAAARNMVAPVYIYGIWRLSLSEHEYAWSKSQITQHANSTYVRASRRTRRTRVRLQYICARGNEAPSTSKDRSITVHLSAAIQQWCYKRRTCTNVFQCSQWIDGFMLWFKCSFQWCAPERLWPLQLTTTLAFLYIKARSQNIQHNFMVAPPDQLVLTAGVFEFVMFFTLFNAHCGHKSRAEKKHTQFCCVQ